MRGGRLTGGGADSFFYFKVGRRMVGAGGGPETGRRVGRCWAVRKTFRFWQKRSPNYDFFGTS
jgi:hypothetical protein